jgi:hypothetical protein
MIAAAEIVSLNNKTKSSNTANAAVVELSIPELVANAVATALAAHKPATKKLNRKKPHQMSYCWSHGPNGSHNSSQCTSAHAKHIADATFANKKGGKTTVWEKGHTTGP